MFYAKDKLDERREKLERQRLAVERRLLREGKKPTAKEVDERILKDRKDTGYIGGGL